MSKNILASYILISYYNRANSIPINTAPNVYPFQNNLTPRINTPTLSCSRNLKNSILSNAAPISMVSNAAPINKSVSSSSQTPNSLPTAKKTENPQPIAEIQKAENHQPAAEIQKNEKTQPPTANQNPAQGCGLLAYREWWEKDEVNLLVNGEHITGTPIFVEENTLRVVNDNYSYFVPLEKIDYIRTNDGLKSSFTQSKY